MKIAVLSDTHGNYPSAVQALSRFHDLSTLIHLGDNHNDAVCIGIALELPVISVSGNCDPHGVAPRELISSLSGTKILITHGDLFQVKTGIERLLRRAERSNVQVVLYGHTHVASIENHKGILFVNPGCLRAGEGSGSLAILSIENGIIGADIVNAVF